MTLETTKETNVNIQHAPFPLTSFATLHLHRRLHSITTLWYHSLASGMVRSTVPNWNSSLALDCTYGEPAEFLMRKPLRDERVEREGGE